MTTTTKTPEKRRPGRPRKGDTPDVGQTIRLPSAVRAGLLALAQRQGCSVSEIVRDKIPGMDWYATESGQHALAMLEHAIALSTTVHSGLAKFAPAVGEPDEWHSLPVLKYNGGQPKYVHVVRQQEHQTRNDAVRSYALKLWGVLAVIKDEQERNAVLTELRDEALHAYVVGFVGLRSWHVFPSTVELNAYEAQDPRPQGVAPTTAEHLLVFDHYAEQFTRWLEQLANSEPGRHVINTGDALATGGVVDTTGDDPGVLRLLNAKGIKQRWSADGASDWVGFEFRWPPDEGVEQCAQRLARQMVERYVEFAGAYQDKQLTTVERFITITERFGYAVQVLRWEQPQRRMKT